MIKHDYTKKYGLFQKRLVRNWTTKKLSHRSNCLPDLKPQEPMLIIRTHYLHKNNFTP